MQAADLDLAKEAHTLQSSCPSMDVFTKGKHIWLFCLFVFFFTFRVVCFHRVGDIWECVLKDP